MGEKKFRVKLNDLAQLDLVAQEIIGYSSSPCVITLQGELGAGKTTLIKALCRVAGVQETVSSPTFTIVNEYFSTHGDPVYHIDLYRVENEKDVTVLGLEDIFERGSWCFIEWPEIIVHHLPDNFISLMIETEVDTHDRIIRLRVPE